VPGQPQSTWTPGTVLANYRQLSFGAYTFPLTFQESSRILNLALDKRKLQFSTGDYIAPNSAVQGRVITITGALGSGMMGTAGNVLQTDADLENERAALAGLQSGGPQRLFVRSDRFINAVMESFDFAFHQDGGAFRYADCKLNFYAADPRYYSTTVTSATYGPITDSAVHVYPVAHLGNVRAWPTINITGACTAPSIYIAQGAKLVKVTFGTLTMVAGDQLIIQCDPRPEIRNFVAIYTPYGQSGVNAMQYVRISDFVNSLDYAQFFPFVEATQFQSSPQTFGFSNTASGNYTVTITYNNTYL